MACLRSPVNTPKITAALIFLLAVLARTGHPCKRSWGEARPAAMVEVAEVTMAHP
jgi:hypothetical protein